MRSSGQASRASVADWTLLSSALRAVANAARAQRRHRSAADGVWDRVEKGSERSFMPHQLDGAVALIRAGYCLHTNAVDQAGKDRWSLFGH